jgi:hypothetical protein
MKEGELLKKRKRTEEGRNKRGMDIMNMKV